MTQEELKKELKAIRKAGKEISATKESARKFLYENGFITKTGKLPKRYGG